LATFLSSDLPSFIYRRSGLGREEMVVPKVESTLSAGDYVFAKLLSVFL
jgi:hypothetical protein